MCVRLFSDTVLCKTNLFETDSSLGLTMFVCFLLGNRCLGLIVFAKKLSTLHVSINYSQHYDTNPK